MTVRVDEVMTRFPTTIRLGTTAGDAATLVGASELGQLMVLGGDGHFAGVLSEGDLLRALLPGPEELRTAGGSVSAGLAAFVAAGRRWADEPVDVLVVRDPITVAPGADVAAAAVVMADRGLRRLPVVEAGRLRGTVSRIDVCRAVLARAAGLAEALTTVPASPPARDAPTAVAVAAARKTAARVAAARARLQSPASASASSSRSTQDG